MHGLPIYKYITYSCSGYTYKISEKYSTQYKTTSHADPAHADDVVFCYASTSCTACTYRLLFIEVRSVVCDIMTSDVCTNSEPYTMYRSVESLSLISVCPENLYTEDAISSTESTLRTFINGFRPCCVLSVHQSVTRPWFIEIPSYESVLFRCLNE